MQKLRTVVMGRHFWLLALLVFSISRLATWTFPFDSNQWIFYYVDRRWVQVGTLYISMWDHKAPLIYGLNGLLYLAVGGNLILQRLVFTAVALIGLWLFYKTAILFFKLLKINNVVWIARLTTLLFAFMANLSSN